MATSSGTGRTESQSFCSSFSTAGGTKSGRMATCWPTLTKAGPRFVSASRKSTACFVVRSRSASSASDDKEDDDFSLWW
eukprot:CAMPEP_0201242548 /NCGR_PEP_ID=MMETSP0852-20130820/38376_1 /ASSEMBLY_ACC=CAM_ASM_000632 /TAXON_ID=183588 /ORGANISM="Pseudo-nitzschia fraudulenta, Strain WWA7" /LENGTH=78 /DNA_ID=CAMNT_0047539257 /DNA_START=27 /DNA_END=263 /DNA_ORIENTATION=-